MPKRYRTLDAALRAAQKLAKRLGRRVSISVDGGSARGNPWRTLSNRRRVFIDDDGRLARGLPEYLKGAHVHDLSELTRGVRTAEGEGEACRRATAAKGAKTFPTAGAGVRALLDANPNLAELLQRETSRADDLFAKWIKGGKRGPKPPGYPELLDAINEWHNLHGKRAAQTWTEALYVITPKSRRWSDFGNRLAPLEEATGLRLVMPSQAERLHAAELDAEACASGAEAQIANLVSAARGGRPFGGEAPF